MNLDELQSVQSRERQTDSLQQLRESFYGDAGEFIQQLREEREAAAERADDPFDAPEVNRLSDDINTAEQTVEAIYERRVGKIVKMASLAAADMPAEEEGLTREERDLFETLVGAIEDNRDHVLDVLAGEASPGAVSSGAGTSAEQSSDMSQPAGGDDDPTPAPSDDAPAPTDPEAETATEDSAVDAADVMGSGDDGSADLPPEIPPDEPPTEQGFEPGESLASDPDQPASDGGTVPSPPTDSSTGTAETASPETPETSESTAGVERRTVRITDDVGEIFGIDQREYDLSTDDVVTLPEQNATPLVERDAAEPIE